MAIIALGEAAINRSYTFNGTKTVVNRSQVANGSGLITTVEMWLQSFASNVYVGIFYETGTNQLKCRSAVSLGNISPGSKQTFSGLELSVETGDFIGIWLSGQSVRIEREWSGMGGLWSYNANTCIVDDEHTYDATYTAAAVSLYGEGETAPSADYYHGLKVQGIGELALCDVGAHPLRVRKGGTTYGIELVAIDDPNASAVRIKTGAGIKAIRKYT